MAITRRSVATVLVVLGCLSPMMGRVDAQVGKAKTTIDPNVAGEKELAALPHMNATLAQSLIKRRPFLSMTDFNAFLSQSLKGPQLTELYGRLFVPLNLNTATREEILMIPNVGDRMVREFFEYRPFKSLAQWHREIDKYVDDAELARLEQYVFVPIDLNTASDADILTIPGLGKRMLHEFKEYRPYKSIEQFRREMGKYVSKQEVARLERYVRID
ncbi:MAG: helix-hairpin-helix domain-containing protein [Acidobacteria bacterium]|nr:helix-hairpin-helix domain-containing protein [Acidobacteriota bacterium]